MLFADPVATVQGLTIFRDWSTEGQYYFLPPEVPRLAKVPGDESRYALRLTLWRRDLGEAAPQGMDDVGGFLDFAVDLGVSDKTLEAATRELEQKMGGTAVLAQVPFLDGDVELAILGRRSTDEASIDSPFVRRVLGTSRPTLYGSQQASFSVVLDRSGAALMHDAIVAGGAMHAIVRYRLKYSAISPAYALHVLIHQDKCLDHLAWRLGLSASGNTSNTGVGTASNTSAAGGTSNNAQTGSTSGTAYMAKAALSQVIDELREKRAIVVTETDFVGGDHPQIASSQESINTIIAGLMGSTWFTPSLTLPSQLTNLTNQPATTPSPTTTTPTPTTTTPTTTTPTPTTTTPTPTTPTPTTTTPSPTTTTPSPTTTTPTTTTTPDKPKSTTTTATEQPKGTSATTSATTSTQSSSSQLTASVEFNLEMVKQTEIRDAEYDLRTNRAMPHEIFPQGEIVLDVPPAEAAKYVLLADLRDEFFQKVRVNGSTTAQWERDGIEAIRVELRYGPRTDGTFAIYDEIKLSRDAATGSREFFTLRDRDNADGQPVVLWYEYRITTHYRSDVALGDQTSAIVSVDVPNATPDGWIRSTARNLVISPRDATPVRPVRLSAGLLRFDLLDAVQVDVRYDTYHQTFRLVDGKHDHDFVIRPRHGDPTPVFETHNTFLYKDGARVELPPVTWSQNEVIVDEPRESILRVQVIAADPEKKYERIRVSLRYEDGDRVVEHDVDLTEAAPAQDWSVRLEDPAKRGYKYRVLTLPKDGTPAVSDWTDGTDTLLIVGVRAVDVLPVEVTYLGAFPDPALLAVKIDLEYHDVANNIAWSHAELLRQNTPTTFTWRVPLVDAKKRSYRWRVTPYRPGHAPHPQDWNEDETTTELVIMPPTD